MNVKLHTPKSLKAGSGMSSKKQFLMSLLATTVSIVLTFGTAAVIDHNKKQKEKRQIAMMVLYDMSNSLKSLEKADSSICQIMELQLQIAENPVLFDSIKYQMARLIPVVDYTETTERIFSSSIETINTIGNVLFTEYVANFYQTRQQYKTNICDSIINELRSEKFIETLQGALDFDFTFYSIISSEILLDMQQQFRQCKYMMNITDEQIEAYQKKKKIMEEGASDRKEIIDSIYSRTFQLQKSIGDAKEKLKQERGI
jgi:hypothetical protein